MTEEEAKAERAAQIQALHRIADTLLTMTDVNRKSLAATKAHHDAWERSDQLAREDRRVQFALLNDIDKALALLRQDTGGTRDQLKGVEKDVWAIREITGEHKTLDDGEIGLDRGLSWPRVGLLLKWAIPIAVTLATGAGLHSLFGQAQQAAGTITTVSDGGVKETKPWK